MAECQLIGSSGSVCFTFCSRKYAIGHPFTLHTLCVLFCLSAGIWLNPIMNLRFIKSWDRKSKDEKYNKRKGRCHFAVVVVAAVVNIMLFWAIYRLDMRYHMADILLLYSLPNSKPPWIESRSRLNLKTYSHFIAFRMWKHICHCFAVWILYG